MLYPLVPKNDANQSLFFLRVLSSSRPLLSLFSSTTTLLLSLKKAPRAYKYAPLPPGAKFLPPIPFPPPPADRPPLAPPRRAIAHLPLPSLTRAIPEARRHPPQISADGRTDGRLAPSPTSPIGSRAPRGDDLRIPRIFSRISPPAIRWS